MDGMGMQSSRFRRLCESCELRRNWSPPVKGEKFRGNLLQEMPIATMHMRLSSPGGEGSRRMEYAPQQKPNL